MHESRALVVCVTALLLVGTYNMHVMYSFNMHDTCMLHACLPAPVQYSHSLSAINSLKGRVNKLILVI